MYYISSTGGDIGRCAAKLGKAQQAAQSSRPFLLEESQLPSGLHYKNLGDLLLETVNSGASGEFQLHKQPILRFPGTSLRKLCFIQGP